MRRAWLCLMACVLVLSIPSFGYAAPPRSGSPPFHRPSEPKPGELHRDSLPAPSHPVPGKEISGFRDRNWAFSDASRNEASFAAFGELLHAGLPGSRPEIAFFLDPVVFRDAVKDMRSRWPGKPPVDLGQHGDLDTLMTALEGRTLYVVGHVEEGKFAFDYGSNSPRIPIGELEAAAKRHRVLVIPIGCNTAGSAEGVGFTQTIWTSEIQRALPELYAASTFRHMLGALAGIGQLQVDIPQTLEKLSMLVTHRATGVEIVRIEISKEQLRDYYAGQLRSWEVDLFPENPFTSYFSWFLIFRLPLVTGLMAIGSLVLDKCLPWDAHWFVEKRSRTKLWLALKKLRWLVNASPVAAALTTVSAWLWFCGVVFTIAAVFLCWIVYGTCRALYEVAFPPEDDLAFKGYTISVMKREEP